MCMPFQILYFSVYLSFLPLSLYGVSLFLSVFFLYLCFVSLFILVFFLCLFYVYLFLLLFLLYLFLIVHHPIVENCLSINIFYSSFLVICFSLFFCMNRQHNSLSFRYWGKKAEPRFLQGFLQGRSRKGSFYLSSGKYFILPASYCI